MRQHARPAARNARAGAVPVVALVGYTNAGKSTLFNALTGAGVFAEDLLFATLDPTMRALRAAARLEAMLSDTVGFISDLPTTLVAAFRATLEEVMEADLILHVRDIANAASPSQAPTSMPCWPNSASTPREPDRQLEVWNKVDLLDAASLQSASERGAPRRRGAGLGVDRRGP